MTIIESKAGMVAHTFNTSTQKADARDSPQIWGQPELRSECQASLGYNKTLSEKSINQLIDQSWWSNSCPTKKAKDGAGEMA